MSVERECRTMTDWVFRFYAVTRDCKMLHKLVWSSPTLLTSFFEIFVGQISRYGVGWVMRKIYALNLWEWPEVSRIITRFFHAKNYFIQFAAHSIGIYQPPAARRGTHGIGNGVTDELKSPSREKTNESPTNQSLTENINPSEELLSSQR